jgi:hypothetical protein
MPPKDHTFLEAFSFLMNIEGFKATWPESEIKYIYT